VGVPHEQEAVMASSRSAAVRERLDHPVIDADGHTIEFGPGVAEKVRELAGDDAARRFLGAGGFGWYRLSPEQRRDTRLVRPPWWALPSENTLDRATAMLPRLLRDRLDETGIDFAVLYPSTGLFATAIENGEMRQAVCRAHNAYHAEAYAEIADRAIPVAIIPMRTPDEALAELDYAVGELGMRAVMMEGCVRRPIAAAARDHPDAARWAVWIDNLCVDSPYDYDPVWQRCLDLGVAPAFHAASMGWGARTSPNNYMYNHIGHFGAAGEATCKAMFFGGVTRRFPELRCAFLEGGVGWAVGLFNDIVGHWEKRNRDAVQKYDPARLDQARLLALLREHGGPVVARHDAALESNVASQARRAQSDGVDDFAAIGIETPDDLVERFVPHFFFGCEADDPANALAFDTRVNAFGAKLGAIFSSDIGHWDVPDITAVLEEAHELVERDLLDDGDFRDFVFANTVRLYTGTNPKFFDGTVVEDACRAEVEAHAVA
jgi:predicted TIM-barrel fold metal-dependent hydrolase